MNPFPWREAMAFGLGVLRLGPNEFWAMTPRELALAIEGARGLVALPMARSRLNELTAAFPDSQGETDGRR